MKPQIHAESSVKKFGGHFKDYIDIHELMDSTKSVIADNRHRCIFHSAFGIFIIEKIFGRSLVNSDGKIIQIRDIAEQHVLEDLGFIPTLQDYIECMEYKSWMHREGKPSSTNKVTRMEKSKWLVD